MTHDFELFERDVDTVLVHADENVVDHEAEHAQEVNDPCQDLERQVSGWKGTHPNAVHFGDHAARHLPDDFAELLLNFGELFVTVNAFDDFHVVESLLRQVVHCLLDC